MMGKKSSYIHWFLSNLPSSLAIRFAHKGKRTDRFKDLRDLNLEDSDKMLISALESGKSFAAIRFGAVELSCLNGHEKIELGFKKHYKASVAYSMKNNAGYFPTDEKSLQRYGDALLPILKETDYLGISGAHMEEYFQIHYCPDASILLYEAMEPLRGRWTSRLKGKKVLVVSPFAKEIASQYQKRELLFPKGSDILPEFTLLTLKAPLTCADSKPSSSSFFEELEKMEREMAKLDFDVALIGAGAYGTFLALEAKRLGKQGIQTGGATMTLFGILGKRWENRPHVAQYVNSNWIRPSEKPDGYQKIEGGAYW